MAISVAAMKRSQFIWGKFVSSAATTGGIQFTTGLNQWGDGMLGIVEIHGATASTLGSGYNTHCLRVRHVVQTTTVSQETYGILGQLVVRSSALGHLHAGIMGTFEGHTTGVTCNASTGGYTMGHGCVVARLGGHAAITATTPVAGFLAWNNGTAALASGSSCGFATGMRSATYPWVYGLYIADSSATNGIYVGTGTTRGMDCQGKARIGTHDWGVGATGILLNGTDDDMVLISAARVNAALTGAYSASYNQLACTAAHTGNCSQFASWNELYMTGTTAQGTGNLGSVWGHIEISGTFTGPASTSNYCGALVGTLMSDAATVTNAGIMGAVIADSILTSGFTNTGKIAAFVAHVNASHPTRANWPIALYIDGADVAFGFGSATNYEDGIKAVAATPAGNTSHAIKILIGATAGYIPVYDNENF